MANRRTLRAKKKLIKAGHYSTFSEWAETQRRAERGKRRRRARRKGVSVDDLPFKAWSPKGLRNPVPSTRVTVSVKDLNRLYRAGVRKARVKLKVRKAGSATRRKRK